MNLTRLAPRVASGEWLVASEAKLGTELFTRNNAYAMNVINARELTSTQTHHLSQRRY